MRRRNSTYSSRIPYDNKSVRKLSIYDFAVVGIGFLSIRFRLFFCRFRFGGVSAEYFGKGRCDRVVIVAMPFIVFVCVVHGIICQFAILVRNSIARFCVLSLPEQSLLCGRLNENLSDRIPFLCIGILRTRSLRRSVQRKHCNSFDLFGVCQ